MNMELKKMKMPKWYNVVCRFWDSDPEDEDILISFYEKKESAFKLRDLLNEIRECEASYLVKFKGKEIKTSDVEEKNYVI